MATGRATRDQTADLKGALPPVQKKHFAAITDPTQISVLLRGIDDYAGTFINPIQTKLVGTAGLWLYRWR